MSERWETTADLDAARRRFEARLGWQQGPTAWALLTADLTVLRANVGSAYLSAAAVALAVGLGGGLGGGLGVDAPDLADPTDPDHAETARPETATHRLTARDLDTALTLLAPAEACTEVQHPNMSTLRLLRAEGAGAVAFFFGSLDDDYVDHADHADHGDHGVAALLREIGRSREES